MALTLSAFKSSGRVECRAIEKKFNPPIEFQCGINLQGPFQNFPGKSKLPDMLLGKTQGAQHLAQRKALSSPFPAQFDEKFLDPSIVIGSVQPFPEMSENPVDPVIQMIFIEGVIANGGFVPGNVDEPVLGDLLGVSFHRMQKTIGKKDLSLLGWAPRLQGMGKGVIDGP